MKTKRFASNLAGLASRSATPANPSTAFAPAPPDLSEPPAATQSQAVTAPPSTALRVPTSPPPRPISAVGDLVSHGAQTMTEREIIQSVDPKRCRPWKYHDRKESNCTPAKLQSLVESIRTEKQKRPALARKLVGDPNFDYELIYGVRRQRACMLLKIHLKIVVKDLSNAQASVEMHIENKEREDVSPMERAITWALQLRDKVFATQEMLAQALNVSQSLVSQAVSAAGILEIQAIGRLFPVPENVPVLPAFKLSKQLKNEKCEAAIVKAANHLYERERHLALKPGAILAQLRLAPERSTQYSGESPLPSIVDKEVNVGANGRMKIKRNAGGKVTLVLPQGIQKEETDNLLSAVKQAIDLLTS